MNELLIQAAERSGVVDAASLRDFLSQYTEDLLSQPVPDSFLALLAKLEAREREIG